MTLKPKPSKLNAPTIESLIADELSARPQQVAAAIKLIDDGATVPFIARYRKEATGSLDDVQLRLLHTRLLYLRDLAERRQSILKSINDQGQLTSELEKNIQAATTKTQLEDYYLPFKPKRRTKASVAREAGLDVLADKLYADPSLEPIEIATQFINESAGFSDANSCLDGARQILMERFSEDASLLAKLRSWITKFAYIRSQAIVDSAATQPSTTRGKGQNKKKDAQKYRDYFDYHERISKVPSHRMLALFRGRNEGVLNVSLMTDVEMLQDDSCISSCQKMLAEHFSLLQTSITDKPRAGDPWLASVLQWTWRIKLQTHLESELFKSLKETADDQAIDIFAKNLKDLLMAAPAGQRIVMGLDPALRSGVKVVVTDVTGQLLTHSVIYPHVPQNQWSQSLRKLRTICELHKVSLISIGNGTGSRETERLVKELIEELSEPKPEFMIISEAGASIYSASELASKEFPDLDVSLRGAVSIARRIQDPLSELVKIDPKSIGVGQYQHDVNQRLLSKSLDAVVEDCVNAVGIDLNIASSQVLSKVAGLTSSTAENIVAYRNQHGQFDRREQLLQVPRLGDKAFEQCAGFLRINNGSNPLDASSVHPEAYSIVEKLLKNLPNKALKDIIGDHDFLSKVDVSRLTSEQFGTITVKDVLSELEKPSRDPRPEFKTVEYKDGVEDIKQLTPDMQLQGVISNVTNFGAFVDIGVHQDGLVHISQLSNTFTSDPRSIVKAGDIVTVWVIDVDSERKRIGLTMLNPAAEKSQTKAKSQSQDKTVKKPEKKPNQAARPSNHQNSKRKSFKKEAPVSAFASLLSDALTNKDR